MHEKEIPILYSFRRCPYAIRARMAILASKERVELREILLKEKPVEFLDSSPSATVPCLVIKDQEVIDESLEIMVWALNQNDPLNWLKIPKDGMDIVKMIEDDFKSPLDKTKYSSRYPEDDSCSSRDQAVKILRKLNKTLTNDYFYGSTPTICDVAIFPFIRQFANIDRELFNALHIDKLALWLNKFETSQLFMQCQYKYMKWSANSKASFFPKK